MFSIFLKPNVVNDVTAGMDTSCVFKVIDLSEETDSDEDQDEDIEYCDAPIYNHSLGPPPLTSMKELIEFRKNRERLNINSPDLETSDTSKQHMDEQIILNPHDNEKSEIEKDKVLVIKKGESRHKILVPKSILPLIREAEGPVFMDVPNIGRVKLTKDSFINNISKHLEPIPNTKSSFIKSKSKHLAPVSNTKVHRPSLKDNIKNTYVKLQNETSLHEERLPNCTQNLRDKKNTENLMHRTSKRKTKLNWDHDYVYNDKVQAIDPTNYHKVVKSCYVSLVRDTHLDKIGSGLMERIRRIRNVRISTSQALINALALIKPTVVINEDNYKLLDFRSYYSKANIVFALNQDNLIPMKLLDNHNLFSGIMDGYIKVVDSKILRDYLMGRIGPTSDKSDCIPVDLYKK